MSFFATGGSVGVDNESIVLKNGAIQLGVNNGISLDLDKYSRIIQGTFTMNQDEDAYLARYWQCMNDGDEIEYDIGLPAGTYNLNIYSVKTTIIGIMEIWENGNLLLSIDGYKSSEDTDYMESAEIELTGSGVRALTIKMNGQNGSASGGRMRLSGLTLQKVE